MPRLVLLAALLVSLDAAAQAPAQFDLLVQAEAAERDADPVRARTLYREAYEADPGSRLARRAEARLLHIEERSEGDLRPLAALLRARRDIDTLDRASLDRFEQEVAAFPPGRVRRESLSILADAWARRFADHDRALAAYAALLADPALEGNERLLAERGRGLALANGGRISEAIAALAHHRNAYRLAPEAVHVRAMQVMRFGEPLSHLLLAAFVMSALLLGGWRGLRRSSLRRMLGPGRVAMWALAVLPPLLMASAFDYTLWPQAPLLAAGCAAVVALAAVAGEGLRASGASLLRRRLVASLAAASCVAWAFLVAARGELIQSMFVWYGV